MTMKNVKTIIKLLFVIAIVPMLDSCYFRPLDYSYDNRAELTFIVDWSETGIDPNGLTISVYPTDGESSVITKLSHSDTTTVMVPMGTYNILVMNETFEDFDYIRFNNQRSFDNIEAKVKGSSQTGAGVTVSGDPDKFAYKTIENFEVTHEMLRKSRIKTPGKLVDELTVYVTPQNAVYPVKVVAVVEGIDKVASAGAYITGFSDGVHIASYTTSQTPTIQKVTFTNREFDDGSTKNGRLRGEFTSFGLRGKTKADLQLDGYLFDFRAVLVDGQNFTETRPINTRIVEVGEGREYYIEIRVGFENDPIVIPDVHGTGGWNVEVGDWEEVIIPIIF
jgi:hypothetical protein